VPRNWNTSGGICTWLLHSSMWKLIDLQEFGTVTCSEFEAFTVMTFQVEVFLVVTPCSVVVGYQRFRGPCCLSQTLVSHDSTTWRHIPEEFNLKCFVVTLDLYKLQISFELCVRATSLESSRLQENNFQFYHHSSLPDCYPDEMKSLN
jgi:hypothetical protein